MDPAAFAALVERCAPTTAMIRPLTAIVRQASSFEPLLITIDGRKPIPIQATDRDEAIQLVTEATAAGRPVRTGLAQLDAEDMGQAGLTVTTTFDACKHIAGVSKLFEARLQAANAKASDRNQAMARVVASFATKASGPTSEPRTQPLVSRGADITSGELPTINRPAPFASEHPNWDVYRSSLGTSAFVYER